ncbi:SDR family NAD(P)-dependent oxidoreductase, partial [Xanthobacter sp. V3C-2]
MPLLPGTSGTHTIADAVAAFGAIDVLVNNAGIGMASVVEATPDSIIREIFETNSFGVFATCRAIIPHMRRQGHGEVVPHWRTV